MSIGLVGQKIGMSRVFTDDGMSVPVTVLAVDPRGWPTQVRFQFEAPLEAPRYNWLTWKGRGVIRWTPPAWVSQTLWEMESSQPRQSLSFLSLKVISRSIKSIGLVRKSKEPLFMAVRIFSMSP